MNRTSHTITLTCIEEIKEITFIYVILATDAQFNQLKTRVLEAHNKYLNSTDPMDVCTSGVIDTANHAIYDDLKSIEDYQNIVILAIDPRNSGDLNIVY